MSYFRTNERYLGGAAAEPPVEPPWDVRAREAGLAGRLRVSWRAPYTPVEAYVICGQAGGADASWQELRRVPAPATEALLHLGPGRWHLAVRACRGDTTSPLAIADCGLPIADWTVPAPPTEVVLPALPIAALNVAAAPPTPPAPPEPVEPTPPPQSTIRNPQSAIEADWAAIDQALRDNSARLGRHGLFVRET